MPQHETTFSPPSHAHRSALAAALGLTGAGALVRAAQVHKGVGAKPSSSTATTPKATTVSAAAKASYTAAIARRAKECVSSINISLWPGVENIHTLISIRLSPDGSLTEQPNVQPDGGLDDDNRRYATPYRDSIVRAFQRCDFAGLRLPPSLYKDAGGRGWNHVQFGYKWSNSG